MIRFNIEEALEKDKARKARAIREQNHIGALLDERALKYLEEYLEANMCAFRGSAGQYDPLDAMRLDAKREVYLRLAEWHKRANKTQ